MLLGLGLCAFTNSPSIIAELRQPNIPGRLWKSILDAFSPSNSESTTILIHDALAMQPPKLPRTIFSHKAEDDVFAPGVVGGKITAIKNNIVYDNPILAMLLFIVVDGLVR